MSEQRSPITRPSAATHLGAATRLSATAAALAALVAAAGGCSVARPEARAVDARIVESRGNATKIEVALELRNTGKDEIELVEYDYVVTLPDGAAYGGKWAALRALPPGRTVAATVPAVLPTASLAAAGTTPWRVSGTVRYRDPQSIARILYEAGILKTETSFSGSGDGIGAGLAAPAAAAGQ
jgi:hypothetical protein